MQLRFEVSFSEKHYILWR